MFKNNRLALRSCAVASLVFLGMLFLFPAGTLWAHGVDLEYTGHFAIEISAHYDSGDPMSGAQVAVFAPGNPAQPWLSGICDDSGRFSFIPDPQTPGLWEVHVRKAGHGGIIRIEVDESGITPPAAGGFTVMQKTLMTLAVIWGLVGTALFFSRRRA